MKLTIDAPKYREILFQGQWYPANIEIDVSFSHAIRLAQQYSIKTNWEKTPYDPSLFKDKKIFGFQGLVDSTSGWGNVSTNLIKYSKDYDVRWIGRAHDIADPFVRSLTSKEILPGMAMVYHEQPQEEWFRAKFDKKIAIVPFETTRVPQSWVGRLNIMDALFVPCHQNIGMMRNSGVTIPIEVIHWGVEPKLFYPLERNNEIFTFGIMGAISKRKGIDILIAAFLEAFKGEKNVRLLIKTSYNYFLDNVKDDRIKVIMTPISNEELIEDFYKKVDCFVFPTRGEGFGMPPLEAMATGIPAIVTNWSGPVEYLHPDVSYPLKYSMERATAFNEQVYKEDCGEWSLPDKEHLIYLLRHCYNNPDEVREKGKRAAEYVKNEWTWEKKIPMFHNALKKYL